MYFVSGSEGLGFNTAEHNEEVSRIIIATYGGAVPGQARVPGLSIAMPYTDIALSGANVDDYAPTMQMGDVEAATIYWPGGSQTAPAVKMAGYLYPPGASRDEQIARGGAMRSFILDATIDNGALERRKQRLEAAGFGDPDQSMIDDISIAVEDLCSQERLPLGFVTITKVVTEQGPGRYASFSYPAGQGVHPTPLFARLQNALRAEIPSSN